MDKKADVKAIMARFQASGASIDEARSPSGPKQPLHPTFSSSSVVRRKPVVENSSIAAIVPPKPVVLKNTNRSDSNLQDTNKTKALSSRFANNQEDSKDKPLLGNKPLKSPFLQNQECKVFEQKPPINKPLTSSISEPKTLFPKAELTSKPNWAKEEGINPAPPKVPRAQQKPNSPAFLLRQQNEDHAESNSESANKPSPQNNIPLKTPIHFRNIQNSFNKVRDEDEQTSKPLNPVPPKPPANKKPSLRGHLHGSPNDTKGIDSSAAPEPKRNPLTNRYALGPAPTKPNRPPNVNLDSFQRPAGSSTDGPGLKKTLPPPSPLIPHPNSQSSRVTQSLHTPPVLPSRPPQPLGTTNQQEDFYDDALTASPPPLPSSSGHPSQRGKEGNDETYEDDNDSGDLYLDIDDRWGETEKQDKKNDKSEKEEKRRLEAEKKEQKEREKKEQETKKRFKLVGPLEVIQQGKARTDCKGSKTELSLKQGQCVDIIRVQGNPEGKWLGRTPDGSIGYVKTTSVEIDFNTLKNRQSKPVYDPEVYDDIDVLSSDNSGRIGPEEDRAEIYDDCVDLNLEISPTDDKVLPVRPKVFQRIFERNRRPSGTKVAPPPSQSSAALNSDKLPASIDEDIYDDVDSKSVPLPPPISSLPRTKNNNKGGEIDPKKQKKFEKEEKDFRKKFKYEGEIQVLYEVTIAQTLTNKKWNNKDLPVKAGEKLVVIVKAVDNKLICRNEEGKFGYVSTSHIATDDGDIYDDIGDDCIYDND